MLGPVASAPHMRKYARDSSSWPQLQRRDAGTPDAGGQAIVDIDGALALVYPERRDATAT
ncbi:hypothetical protein ACWC09_48220 [Streptomyces sp. NPDC001617]